MRYLDFPSWKEFSFFLEDERHVLPQSTLKSIYLVIVSYFKEQKLDRNTFRSFLRYLRTEKNLSTNRINKYITMAKHVDAYFRLREIDDWKSYPVEEPQKAKIIMTDEQMKAICNCVIANPRFRRDKDNERQDEYNLRWKTIFSVLRFSGMPPDDLCRLTWNNYLGTHFEVYRKKTRKTRKVPIPEQVRVLLDQLPHYPHNYIFGSDRGKLKQQTLNKELKKRVEQLGYDTRITAYCFRYSFDTLCAIHGGESTLPQIAKIAGHSLQTAYNYYLQYSIQDLQDALESSHPGLRGEESIDTIKRIIMESIKKFVDMSKYNVEVKITPKKEDSRQIILS